MAFILTHANAVTLPDAITRTLHLHGVCPGPLPGTGVFVWEDLRQRVHISSITDFRGASIATPSLWPPSRWTHCAYLKTTVNGRPGGLRDHDHRYRAGTHPTIAECRDLLPSQPNDTLLARRGVSGRTPTTRRLDGAASIRRPAQRVRRSSSNGSEDAWPGNRGD